MNKEITLTRVNTNLQILDKVKNMSDDREYIVSYIDLVEAKAVLTSLNYIENSLFLVIDLGHNNFEIID